MTPAANRMPVLSKQSQGGRRCPCWLIPVYRSSLVLPFPESQRAIASGYCLLGLVLVEPLPQGKARSRSRGQAAQAVAFTAGNLLLPVANVLKGSYQEVDIVLKVWHKINLLIKSKGCLF